MPRYKLTVAYDGTDFCGWQKQEPRDPDAHPVKDDPGQRPPEHKIDRTLQAGEPGRVALRTVQAVVERAVREVVREPVMLQGASRTDSGVHARGQVAAFTAETWPEDRGLIPIIRGINARLPGDVLITRAQIVPDAFDPIADCQSKGYSYRIYQSIHRPLWQRRGVYHTWKNLDLDAMRTAAAHLVGEHDFESFAAMHHGRASTVRTIFACDVTEEAPNQEPKASAHDASVGEGRLLRIDVSGNGFLYNMVRIIAGTLHEVGRGKIDPDSIPDILQAKDRRRAGVTLPPEGLRLEWIDYGDRDTVTTASDTV
ncbi:MAG: tRNA pseudouridine synthase A [Planctomycetota bacterium]